MAKASLSAPDARTIRLARLASLFGEMAGVLTLAGCSGGSSAGASLPAGVTQSRIAGTVQLPVGPGWVNANGDAAGDGRIVLSSAGDAFVAWTHQVAGGTYSVTASQFVHGTSWAAPVVLEPSMAATPGLNLFMDRADAATVAWFVNATTPADNVRFSRSRAGGNWSPLPVADPALSPVGMLVGGAGRIVMLGPGPIVGSQVNGAKATIFDPATGWGPVTGLSEALLKLMPPSQAYADYPVTIASDGTVLVAYGGEPSVMSPPGSLVFQTYSTTGWSTASPWDPCLNAALVPDIDGTVLAFCDTDTTHSGNDQPVTSRRFSQGAWTSGPTFTAMDVTYSAKVARSGHFMMVWNENTGMAQVRAVYGSGQSVQSIDLNTDYPVFSTPLVGMDAQGRAVVAWTEQTDSPNASGSSNRSRWPLKHVFYARYSPDTGWTKPVQVDGDDGVSHGSVLTDLAVNDAGTAMALWIEDGLTTIQGTDPSLWVAPLP